MKTHKKNFSAFRQITKTLILCLFVLLSQQSRSQNVVVAGALFGNGTYPDLGTAFAAINGGVQTGAAISVNIIANTSEPVSAVLNAGAWLSVSVTPSGGSYSVTGNIAGPLIDLNGADRVTIDGINTPGSGLTISNSNTGNLLTSTIRFRADAVLNTVSNCTLLGSATAANLGVVTFSTAGSVGNNSITIMACNIGPEGVNFPVNGIYSSGTAGFDNLDNNIVNCNIFDFYSSTLASAGINIAANNTSWFLIGNKLFQTVARTFGTANTHRAIQIAAGNKYAVAGNTIGYSSASATGTWSMTSAVATRFIAIDLAVGTTSATSVIGNTVSAITLTTSSNASTANGILCGVNVTAGNVTIGSNLLGGTSGTDLLAGVPTAAQGAVVGINSSSTGTITIVGNTMGGFSSSGTTAAISGGVSGINISGLATGLIISGNMIGNATTDNMRGGTLGLTTGLSPVSGINMNVSLAPPIVVVSSNTIQNMASYGTATGGYVRGMWTNTGATTTYLISDNTINNLVSNNGNISVGNALIGTAGIILASGNNNIVSGNSVTNISNINTVATALVVGGITHANATNTTIRHNRIYNMINQGTSTGAPGVASGIIVRSGTGTMSIFNNMISLGNNQISNTAFVGIWGMHGSAPNPKDLIYFNTINIEGTAASGAQPSFGFVRGDFTGTTRTAAVDFRNNLITNTRSGGTGVHCAIGDNYGIVASASNWTLNASNYNVLNANPATIGWWNSAQTFTGWKSVTGMDANSFSGIPVTYVSSATDLHLSMGVVPTYIESGAQAIPGYNDDYDAQLRPGPSGSINGGALAPDIGADEIDGKVLYCTAANGGSLVPSTFTACSGQTLAATAASFNIGYGTTYQWQVALTPGGPYSNITTGSGMATTSHTSAALPSGTFYIVLKTTCPNVALTGLSNEIMLTVQPTPTVSAATTTSVICSTQSLNLVGTPGTGTAYQWKGPDGFLSSSQNTMIASASINAAGNYSFTSSVNGCTSTPAIVSVTVNQTPTSLTISPATPSICQGGLQALVATGGNVPGGVFNFTPQVNQNTNTTYPAPYSIYWGGQKMQFLVLASELTAAGLVAGPLTSIQFPVVSKGANWGTLVTSCENFQVSVGHTGLTSVGATFQGGLTLVCAGTNFTPNVGYGNIHSFAPTFAWDGVSNLIVETVFSNNTTGDQADAVISYNSPTAFQSTMIWRADGASFASIAAATTTNEPTNMVRPDFILKGQTRGTYTWTPATHLSTTTGSVVNATPPATSVYTVMVSTGICSTSVDQTVTVIPVPTLAIAATSTAICIGSSATLTASGANSYQWSTASTNTSIVVSPPTNSVYIVFNQTLPCPIVSASISINVNPVPTIAVAPTTATVCALSSASFTITGANTYSWSTGSTAASETVYPASTTVYTATGINALGCSASSLITVTTKTLPLVSVFPSTIAACMQSEATFTAQGANTYSWSTGLQNSVLTVTATANATHTVTGFGSNGCSANKTVSLTALALPVLTVTPAVPKICKNESISLSVAGAGTYVWKPGNNTTAVISVTPNTTSTYSVTGTDANNCSVTTTLSIIVDACTGIADNQSAGNRVALYPNPSTGLITAVFDQEGEKEILITNSVGAIIGSTTTRETTINIDLSGGAKGVYFVRISAGKSSSNHRIIIH